MSEEENNKANKWKWKQKHKLLQDFMDKEKELKKNVDTKSKNKGSK